MALRETHKGHEKSHSELCFERSERVLREVLARVLSDATLLSVFNGRKKETSLLDLEKGWEKRGKAEKAHPEGGAAMKRLPGLRFDANLSC
jgi:hypothetical protein